MRYKKAPILEAVFEFRWLPVKPLSDLSRVVSSSTIAGFGEANQRVSIDATLDVQASAFSHQKRQVGYEVASRDGAQLIHLEEQKFTFVQRAPYDRWELFSNSAYSLLANVIQGLELHEFTRMDLRFINRIDIPLSTNGLYDTDDYVTVKFDGPRMDIGVVEEFQMRVVKPTSINGIHYALALATVASPLPDHSAILLDIDVFALGPVAADMDAIMGMGSQMRDEKNELFELCVTDKARRLFGGTDT